MDNAVDGIRIGKDPRMHPESGIETGGKDDDGKVKASMIKGLYEGDTRSLRRLFCRTMHVTEY